MPDVVGRLRSPRLTPAPGSPAPGEMYYDTSSNTLYWWSGTAWVPAGKGGVTGSSWVSALAAQPVLDGGASGQIRAGRQLTNADFTALGLPAPSGLWNLSDLTDASGHARTLTNKGTVAFAAGINGTAATATQFTGSTAQTLYVADTGTSDPLRTPGSWGAWFRTAKRADPRHFFSRGQAASSQYGWFLGTSITNALYPQISLAGNDAPGLYGATDVCDDRWHFGVATYDGTTLRIYVDGVLDGSVGLAGPMFASSAALNIGSYGADGATASIAPWLGLVDEAFVTVDVLSEDQIRYLYCAKIPHTLGKAPTAVALNVRRRRKGGTWTTGSAGRDFPTTPQRLYNFTGVNLIYDEGFIGYTLTNNGAVVNTVAADGTRNNAAYFDGASYFSASDANSMSGTSDRSYGCWLQTFGVGGAVVLACGASATTSSFLYVGSNVSGAITSGSGSDVMTGPFVADGQWHFVVATETASAVDGLARKLYVDGKLVAFSTVITFTSLGGAGKFTIGANNDGTGASKFKGSIDGLFVVASVLSAAQIATLYAKGSQPLPASPKDPGAHIEAMDTSNVYATFGALESQHQVDLLVGA